LCLTTFYIFISLVNFSLHST